MSQYYELRDSGTRLLTRAVQKRRVVFAAADRTATVTERD